MSSVPLLKPCTSYAAGHTVHWIQALHTANKPDVAARTRGGTLIGVVGQELAVRFDAAEPDNFLNHDPPRLLAIAGRLPCAVTVNDKYAILRVGSFCFSVLPAARGPLVRCPTDDLLDESLGALAVRVATHGGFSVPVHPRGRNMS